jgi:hypothetical protein
MRITTVVIGGEEVSYPPVPPEVTPGLREAVLLSKQKTE